MSGSIPESATGRAETLAGIETALAAGQADGLAGPLAGLIAEDPADPRPYRLGTRALGMARAPTGDDWTALIRLLVGQQAPDQQAPDRPRILHHGLASLLTSGSRDTARRMTATILPALMPIDATSQGVALLLMVTRSILPSRPPGAPSQADITALHLRHFPALSAGDLALPYSVMFNAAAFGANRDDLLARYPDPARIPADDRLGLRHILLLDRLGAGPVFTAPDNADLADRLCGLDDDDDERAAARLLILRYWRASGVLDAATLTDLGLDPALLTHAASLPRPAPRARVHAPDLQARPRKALRATQNTGTTLLRMALPFLNRPGRKPRVALCVSGQMRGYRAALDTWRRALLPFAEFDIHIHTWSRTGRAAPHPFRAVLPFEGPRFCAEWRRIGTLDGYETLQARYPTLFAALDSTARVDAKTLQALYGARKVVVEDDDDPRFAGFTNQDRMHHKIAAAHDLAQDSDHDLVLRLRPDLSLKLPGFSWPDLHRACLARPVIFAEDGYGLHYRALMMGDQMAVGAPDVMAIHAATARTYPPLAALDLAGFPPALTGHVSLAGTCWLAGITVTKLPFRRGPLLESETLPATTIRAALETDADRRNDAHDRVLLTAVARDLTGQSARPLDRKTSPTET
ncbi:MAG: hypothetical protein CML66_28130 [Rhodobacteraceae bacterium]|nr:hypothetical protein [Paracoccaceae bacterium]MAY47698.1 hypothetical protein [Paracoccaceae bacterium]